MGAEAAGSFDAREPRPAHAPRRRRGVVGHVLGWPRWFQLTLTGGLGFTSGVLVLALAAAEVRANALRGAALAPRVEALEQRDALAAQAIKEVAEKATAALAEVGKASAAQTNAIVGMAGRVETLERHESEDRANAANLKEAVGEIRGDVKVLLQRTK